MSLRKQKELVQGRRRSPGGMTADPCPLCKKAAGDKYSDGCNVPFREKDSVCSRCLKEIQDLRNTTRRLERMVSKGEIKNARPRRVYPFPRPYHGKHDTAEAIATALRNLCRLIGGDADENEWYRSRPNGEDEAKATWLFDREQMAATFYRSMTDEEHNALQSLFEAIKENNEDAYQQGLRRGKNILLSLQAGDISLSEFEEKQ